MSDPIPEEPLYSIRVNTSRHVGDSKTWKIALNTTGMGPPRNPDFVLESSCFQLRSSQENYRYLSYKVDAWPYESCVLKYKYVASDRRGDLWDRLLKTKLDDLTREELQKLSEEEKPAFMKRPNPPDSNFNIFNSTFEKPPTWTFYNDLVLNRREEWVEHRWRVKLAKDLAVEKELPSLVQLA